MAYNDSPDNEFDQEMERILREHFNAEHSNLRPAGDPWEWLESRLEEPATPSFFSRILGFLNPVREGRLSPAFAVAGVAVVAVAVSAVVWTISGPSGPATPDGLAAVQATKAPASATAPAAAPGLVEATRIVEREREVLEQAPAATTAPAAATAQRAPASAPQPTEAPVTMMEGEEESESRPAPVATAVPAAAMPAATVAPAAVATPTTATAHAAVPLAATAQRGPTGTAGADGAAGTAGPAGPAGAVGPQARTDAEGTPPDTTFRDYQRQPLVAASEDNVSTFSLDTDRTSYHLALNWARNGYEVNPDSVRAEEWLNAFDYRYDPPQYDDSFAITSDLYPHPLDENKQLARIAFQAPQLVDDRPLNVTLVLDASGSMADGNRVDIAREAAESIRQSLRPNDRIAVVHFTSEVIRRFTVGHSAPDAFQVLNSISQLQPHGSTNVQAGLNMGVRLADKIRDQRPDAYNYVILMSDGVANVDATEPFGILETAYDSNTRSPLRLITIGVGINNYNDLLLEQLAQHGNGWYRYLDSAEQAQATFTRENWLALSIPFADQTRAQVTWDTDVVKKWRIIGYENRVTPDHTFTEDRREFAELYSGAATTVFYELELHDAARRLASAQLGHVELRWVKPDTGEAWTQSATLSGSPRAGFEGRDGSLAHFGAIVALAADLYGVLPNYPEGAYAEVYRGLTALQTQLHSLVGDLGRLEAYKDFSFLLDHITEAVWEMVPEGVGGSRSGYSR